MPAGGRHQPEPPAGFTSCRSSHSCPAGGGAGAHSAACSVDCKISDKPDANARPADEPMGLLPRTCNLHRTCSRPCTSRRRGPCSKYSRHRRCTRLHGRGIGGGRERGRAGKATSIAHRSSQSHSPGGHLHPSLQTGQPCWGMVCVGPARRAAGDGRWHQNPKPSLGGRPPAAPLMPPSLVWCVADTGSQLTLCSRAGKALATAAIEAAPNPADPPMHGHPAEARSTCGAARERQGRQASQPQPRQRAHLLKSRWQRLERRWVSAQGCRAGRFGRETNWKAPCRVLRRLCTQCVHCRLPKQPETPQGRLQAQKQSDHRAPPHSSSGRPVGAPRR